MKRLTIFVMLSVLASCQLPTEPELPVDFTSFQFADEYVGTIETVVEQPDKDRISQWETPAFSKSDSVRLWFYPDKGAWFCETKQWRATGTDGAGSRYWLRNGKAELQAAFFSRPQPRTIYNSEIPRGTYALRQDTQGRLLLEQKLGEEPTLAQRRQKLVLTRVNRPPQPPPQIDYLQPDSATYTGLVEVFIDSAYKNINTGNDVVYGYTYRADLTVWFDPATQRWTCRGRGWFGSIGISTYKVQDKFIDFAPILANTSIPGWEVPTLRYHYKRVNGRTLVMEQFPFENEWHPNMRQWQRMTLTKQNSN